MITTFRLPDLGEGLTESTIVEWEVAQGDTVAWGDVLAQVETAKATVELPSPRAGVVSRLFVDAGDTIDVGTPIVEFEVDDENPSDDETPNDDGGRVAEDAETPGAETDGEGDGEADGGRVAVLVGSVKVGDGTRPTRSPRTFAQEPFVREEEKPRTARASRRERVTGLRKHTAEAMVSSAFTAPQASCFLQVDVTETRRLVADLKGEADAPSFFAMVSRAVVIAASRTSGVNATFHADDGEIEFHGSVNLGIAVATDRGLVVASIDDADRLDATDLTTEIAERAASARDGSISPAALTSSTLTVSNVGVFGIDGGIPILNPGQSAIVAVGAVRRIPWEHDDEIALRDICTITVSFDHRVIDGREAGEFLADVGRLLARPGLALARG